MDQLEYRPKRTLEMEPKNVGGPEGSCVCAATSPSVAEELVVVEPSTVRVEFVSAEGRSWIDVMPVLFEPDEVEVMTDEALSVLSKEGFPADICG
jgi:hypothetical protein